MNAPRTKIFVGHLPDGCRSEDLILLFSKFGTVTEADVINKYGFVHMRMPEEAEAAIRGLNNYNLKGSSISVEPSKSRLHPEPGAPGRARGGSTAGNAMASGFTSRRGGPPRNGFGPRVNSDGVRQFDKPNSDLFFNERSLEQDRSRSFTSRSSFEQQQQQQSQPSSLFSLPIDEFRQRTLPAPVGTRDPYTSTASIARPDTFDSFLSSANYLFSSRSPQRTMTYDPLGTQSRPYDFYDCLSINPTQAPSDMSRRSFY